MTMTSLHAVPAGPARVVAITGASSGIGRCTASLFASTGWRVGLIARGQPGLEAVCGEIVAAGGAACVAAADVRDAAALEAAAAAIEDALGPIDVWINCAGNGVYGRFLDVPAHEFDCVTDVTYGGTVNGTRVALRRMLPRDAGVVVNVCSAIAYHGMPLLTSYSGAKAAVRGFTDGVRAELVHDRSRVRATIVFPPAVNTPFFSHAVTYMAAAAGQAGVSAGDRGGGHFAGRVGAAARNARGCHYIVVRTWQQAGARFGGPGDWAARL
jgi:short-subunit dehydrogenase